MPLPKAAILPAQPGVKTAAQPNGATGAEAVPAAVAETVKPGRTASLLKHLGVPEEIGKQIGASTENVPAGQETGEPAEEEPDGEPAGEEPTGEEPAAHLEDAAASDEPGEEEPAGDEPNGEHEQDTPGVQKRINTLTKRNSTLSEKLEAAEAEAEDLRSQLEAAGQPRVAPSPQDPLPNVRSMDQLAQKRQEALALRNWCRQNRGGTVINEGLENERTITPDEVSAWADNAQDMLEEHIPAKATQLEAQGRFDEIAKGVYPALDDKRTAEYQISQAVMQSIPGLASHPARKLVIGDYLLGSRIRLSPNLPKILELMNSAAPPKGKTNGKAPNGTNGSRTNLLQRPIPPIAPDTARPPAGLPAAQGNKRVADAMENVVAEGGSVQSIAKAIGAMRQASGKGKGPRHAVAV